MNSLIKQEILIYTLKLPYFTICFDQTERHGLAITQFYKRQLLGGRSQVELQSPLHSMTLSLNFFSEKTTVWSIILNRSSEVEIVDHSTMTSEQQVYKQHVITHTHPNRMKEDLLSECQQRWIPSNLKLHASLQSEVYIYLNADWNKNSRISTTIS